MKGYRICDGNEALAIKLFDTNLIECELTADEQEWAEKAAMFWKIKCEWHWVCEATNDNGIDDRKSKVDILPLDIENIVVDNGKAVGYYVECAKKVLFFKDHIKFYYGVYHYINKEYVGGMGDIEEYEVYSFYADDSDDDKVMAWRGDKLENGVLTIGDVYSIDDLYYSKFNCFNEVIIEDGVEGINKRAFMNCQSLKKVVIPNSVYYIEEDAFQDCASLEEVTIKGNFKIDESVFKGCVSLIKLNVPKTIEKLGAFVRNDDGELVIKCLTFANKKKDAIVTEDDKFLVPYICTPSESEQVAKTLKQWRQKELKVVIQTEYSSGELKYKDEDEKIILLNPEHAIVHNGEVVGYHLYVFYGKDFCFLFDEYKDENSFVYKDVKTSTIGAYYYHAPHTKEEETTTYSIIKADN